MKCLICNTNDSKYKCPKCEIGYCSIQCYKQHKLTHSNDPIPPPSSTSTEINNNNKSNNNSSTIVDVGVSNNSDSLSTNKTPHTLFDKILADPHMKHYLTLPALQKYLSLLIKYSNTVQQDKNYLLNLKLMDLRIEGLEYTPIVEEFIQRFLYLLEQN